MGLQGEPSSSEKSKNVKSQWRSQGGRRERPPPQKKNGKNCCRKMMLFLKALFLATTFPKNS